MTRPCLLGVALVFAAYSAPAEVRITEIHYHPSHAEATPEPTAEEFLELTNSGSSAVDLTGWRVASGVDFTFPAATIGPGESLVVAADPATLLAQHPGVDPTRVFGPWTGKLSNSGERVRVRDASDATVDSVTYAAEGDWATRARGPDDLGHTGWTWATQADRGGSSLELVNPALPGSSGQNWAASSVAGGTPAAPNSSGSPASPPLITGTAHSPPVPSASEPVVVSCELVDTAPGASAVLFYRAAGSGAAPFTGVPMSAGSDGRHTATIPGQPDRTVVEFYVEATGANTLTRTWPAPVAPDGLQLANALYQVDDSFDPQAVSPPGSHPLLRVVMTPAEKTELDEIGDTRSEAESNAEMNCTFISQDGSGIRVRYLASIRNRGASSRTNDPNNHLVEFRDDEPWDGRDAVKLNAVAPYSQVLGSWLFRRFGIETAEAVPVRLHLNGDDEAEPGSPMYGRYAMVEAFGDSYTDSHWPSDPGGNLYQVRDDEDTGEEGQLQWEGPDTDSYRDTYFKQTNRSADDFSDLIALTDSLNNSPVDSLFAEASTVAHLVQWARMLAIDTLLGNREGGLITAKGDDYALYSGASDRRFYLVPHDLDSLGAAGRNASPGGSIFTYAGVEGLTGLFGDPEFLGHYYRQLIDLLANDYTPSVVDPIIDDALGSWVEPDEIADAKGFIAPRRESVLGQIPVVFSAVADLPTTAEGYFQTSDGTATIHGTFDATRTLSVRVNGRAAELDHVTGEWTVDANPGDGVLSPGLNRVVVQAFSGKLGGGDIVDSTTLDVWNDTGSVTPVAGVLAPDGSAGSARMTVRPDYFPGVPVLVKLELLDADGNIDRDRWDATATLTTDRPDIVLTPSTVTLHNGRGSALVDISGSGAGAASTTLLPTGSVWKYLDDGSDQGTAWRGPGFDDTSWPSGPAELGYGDSATTTVGFIDTDPDQGGTQKNATTYFRTTFAVDDPDQFAGLTVSMQYDDGAIVYINGAPAAITDNMSHGMAFDEFASDDTPDEDEFFEFPVPASLLVAGTNTIAVEIHQGDDGSSDISFDLGLTASALSPDPGAFTLRAALAGRLVTRPLASLGPVTPTEVSGPLASPSETWSGVVRVTGDVTVGTGQSLTIEPGTLVMLDGTSEPGSTAGTDIIVEDGGSLVADGTASLPVTLTATAPGTSWGQLLFDSAGASALRFTHLHRAGHAPGGGHTGRGRVVHLLGSSLTLEDSTLTDNFGKLGESDSSGGAGASLVVRRCHLARSVMGFETTDTAVTVEDTHITEMKGRYREDGVTDDDDAIYIHEAPGQDLTLRRVVVADTDDDGIDTLDATGVVIEDVIVRDCFDKGISILGGDVTILRTLLAGNDIGASAKDDAAATFDHVTVVGGSIGLQVENKTGSDLPSTMAVSNSIVLGDDPVRTDYAETGITFAYSLLGEPWPFAGSHDNFSGDPGFANPAAGDFRLTPGSVAVDAGDPAAPLDPDGTRADVGKFALAAPGGGGGGAGDQVVWRPQTGPYYLTDDVTVPAGLTLVIEPGTAIYLAEGKRLTVEGALQAVGTAEKRIQVNALPGAPFVPDTAGNGSLPPSPPKSDGIKIVDSMSEENVIAYVDFANAQDSEGSLGVIRSWALVDHCTFRATHLRMLYTDDSTLTVQHCEFADMFGPDEFPAAIGLDNVSEHIKGVGSAPEGGHLIIRSNRFGTNKGHNDCVDVESPRRPGPIAQIIGNVFAGAGDELLDLGGDVYVAGNYFQNVAKDDETSDRGYANSISTGDGGPGTTISVARNIFVDVDHAISLKRDTATIFENNTVHQIHPDFDDRFGNPSVSSVINFFIPTDTSPTPGDGAYVAGNIFSDLTRVFSGADEPGDRVTPIEFTRNLVDPAMPDAAVGDGHLGQTVFDLGPGNTLGDPRFVDPDGGDFRLATGSPAIGAGLFGHDLGAMVPAGAWISGEPPALTTSTTATLTVGGPGMFAFRWRLDGGPWSDALPIGDGFEPPAATARTAPLALSGLSDGEHVVEVIGQDFAGAWQEIPTASLPWTVASSLAATATLSEVVATGDVPSVELFNPGVADLPLDGWSLGDRADRAGQFPLPAGSSVPAGGYLTVSGTDLPVDRGGGELFVFAPDAGPADHVTYGHQAPGYSIARIGQAGLWGLASPTPSASNAAHRLGDSTATRITEWLASGLVTFDDDFVEVANPTAFPLALGGLVLTDNAGRTGRRYVFPPLSYLGPGAALAIPGDELGFGLASSGESLALVDGAGLLLDAAVFGNQNQDYSQTRGLPGGVTGFARLPTPGLLPPSPGSPEEAEWERAHAIFDHLRITELMFDPSQGTEYEFIELQNTGPTALDLSGVRIAGGVRFTFGETVLAPGAYILVVENPVAFTSRYGPGLPVAGQYEGKLDNGGEEIILLLPAPFESAALRFTYDDAWFPEADGGGKSLVATDPTAPASSWTTQSGWAASNEEGGSPAGFTAAATGLAAWLDSFGITGAEEDDDLDGIAHIVEYALGLDPLVPEVSPLELVSSGGGVAVLMIGAPLPARDDVTITVSVSPVLGAAPAAWQPITTRAQGGAWAGPATISPAPGGTTVTDSSPPAAARQFYRIEVTLTP